MTNRRRLLHGLGVTMVGSLAGCAGKVEELADSVTGGGRTIGDTATHNGVEVTPIKYVLADSAKRVYANNHQNIRAAEGATYILTHLTVSHEGDSAQELPKSRMQDAIDLYYDGERISESLRDDATEAYIIDETRLTTYGQALRDANATGKVYPGKEVDGWLFHQVASNFSPEKLEFHITWNKQITGDGAETTHKWTYTEDTEVVIEDVEGDDDGNTISM